MTDMVMVGSGILLRRIDVWGLRLLDQHMDQVVPRDAEPELFNKHGHLMDRELQAYLDRARQTSTKPRVLAYLSTISNSTKPPVAIQE